MKNANSALSSPRYKLNPSDTSGLPHLVAKVNCAIVQPDTRQSIVRLLRSIYRRSLDILPITPAERAIKLADLALTIGYMADTDKIKVSQPDAKEMMNEFAVQWSRCATDLFLQNRKTELFRCAAAKNIVVYELFNNAPSDCPEKDFPVTLSFTRGVEATTKWLSERINQKHTL